MAVNAEQKKEEFRRYLEKSGVVENITKVLVGLYEQPEKPANALDFIRTYLGTPPSEEIDRLTAENNELRKENDELKARLEDMTSKVSA